MIAIIAILAAMLLPALAKARDAAQTSNCISNLKQLGLGTQMYITDWRHFPVTATNTSSAAGGTDIFYTHQIAPYLGIPITYEGDLPRFTEDLSAPLFHCPSSSDTYKGVGASDNLGINLLFSGKEGLNYAPNNEFWYYGPITDGRRWGAAAPRIQSPAKTYWLTEGNPYVCYSWYAGVNNVDYNHGSAGALGPLAADVKVKGMATNVGWADGHATKIIDRNIANSDTTENRSYWWGSIH